MFSYGYDSQSAFSKAVTDINDAAAMLLERIRGERRSEEEKTRKVMFVAHSLGGILVKKVGGLLFQNQRGPRKAANGWKWLFFLHAMHCGGYC